ncbi:hypothetical protein HK096_004983 [Nowakowskiella sp. JEL0078]|nr:hypothetical protein HK096_004983 [Nowakowskiella sp. JEL0078]
MKLDQSLQLSQMFSVRIKDMKYAHTNSNGTLFGSPKTCPSTVLAVYPCEIAGFESFKLPFCLLISLQKKKKVTRPAIQKIILPPPVVLTQLTLYRVQDPAHLVDFPFRILPNTQSPRLVILLTSLGHILRKQI